jgi:hypothetical protein
VLACLSQPSVLTAIEEGRQYPCAASMMERDIPTIDDHTIRTTVTYDMNVLITSNLLIEVAIQMETSELTISSRQVLCCPSDNQDRPNAGLIQRTFAG